MDEFPIFSLSDDGRWAGISRRRTLEWTEVFLRRRPSVPGTVIWMVRPRLAQGIPAGFLDWARRAEIAEAAGFRPQTYESLQHALDTIDPAAFPTHPDNHLDRRGLAPVRPFEISRWAAWPAAIHAGEDPLAATRRLLATEVRMPLTAPSGDLVETIGVTDLSAITPVIVHVPHAGRTIPDSCLGAFTVSRAALAQEQDRITDHATDRIAVRVGAVSCISSGLSRLVVDVERFEGDEEEMNLVGMGVLYTHGTQGQRIRRVDDDTARRLLEYFGTYSELFAELVDRTLEQHGRAVILDIHSFPAAPLPYELHQDDRRPELCVGVDRVHTPDALVGAAREAFADWDIAVNEPFSGSYVPLRHLGDPRVSSVMLEIRRDMYLDEARRPEGRALSDIGRRIRGVHQQIRDDEI